MTRQTLAFVAVLLAAVTRPLAAEHTAAHIDDKDLFETFYQIASEDDFLSNTNFEGLDVEVNKIFLYQLRPRGSIQSPSISNMLSQGISQRLLATQRFKLVECFECRITHISLSSDNFEVSTDISNNARFRSIAKRIGANGALTWYVVSEGDNAVLNMNLVRVGDGEILWSKQYSGPTLEPKGPDSNIAFTAGFINQKFERKTNSGAPETLEDKSLGSIVNLGIEYRSRSIISEKAEFAIGAEYAFNGEETDHFNIDMISLGGRVISNVGNFLELAEAGYYIGFGQVILFDNINYILKLGIELGFTRDLFADLGIVYIPSDDYVTTTEVDGYSNDIEVGGTGFAFSLGIKF